VSIVRIVPEFSGRLFEVVDGDDRMQVVAIDCLKLLKQWAILVPMSIEKENRVVSNSVVRDEPVHTRIATSLEHLHMDVRIGKLLARMNHAIVV